METLLTLASSLFSLEMFQFSHSETPHCVLRAALLWHAQIVVFLLNKMKILRKPSDEH